jgi:hypothetical protein
MSGDALIVLNGRYAAASAAGVAEAIHATSICNMSDPGVGYMASRDFRPFGIVLVVDSGGSRALARVIGTQATQILHADQRNRAIVVKGPRKGTIISTRMDAA